jgi:hypothetical protein
VPFVDSLQGLLVRTIVIVAIEMMPTSLIGIGPVTAGNADRSAWRRSHSAPQEDAVCNPQGDRSVVQVKGGSEIRGAVTEEAISESSVRYDGGKARAVLAHVNGHGRGSQEGGKNGDNLAAHTVNHKKISRWPFRSIDILSW